MTNRSFFEDRFVSIKEAALLFSSPDLFNHPNAGRLIALLVRTFIIGSASYWGTL